MRGCGFVGCASHRFNLAVQDFNSRLCHHINRVQSLMKNLITLISALHLRQLTLRNSINIAKNKSGKRAIGSLK